MIKLTKILLAMTAAAILALPAIPAISGEPIWDPNTVQLESHRLAPGVYAVIPIDAAEKAPKGLPVATTGGFVVGEKGVVLIETMINRRLFDQLVVLVKAVTDRPIRFAVNTSFHGDHSYGNYYIPSSVAIIQHQNAKAYVDQHFAKDVEFMIQNFGQNRGMEELKPRTGDVLVSTGSSMELDLGGRVVQIRDFGFAQTGGDLFVWEPESKVLWTGNPIIASKPSLPWLLDGHLVETLATIREVYEFLPADARVVPGHGTLLGREDLKWFIDYLETVRAKVQAAVDRGLSLEETVAEVKMPEFRGYALFDWVHPGLNVPAAYKDLKN